MKTARKKSGPEYQDARAVMSEARKLYLAGRMDKSESARLCLFDAEANFVRGDWAYAARWARKSINYILPVGHPSLRKKTVKKAAKRKSAPKRNPIRKPGRPGTQVVLEMQRAYEAFHKAEPRKVSRVVVPKPGPAWLLGQVAYVAYFAERDGKVSLYHHDFKLSAAPYLCIGKDGKIMIGGGRYHVGDRGIVDRDLTQ